ncbi:hypothetical protein H0H87_001801, partial [Tephrocybe sp. NHM501043]
QNKKDGLTAPLLKQVSPETRQHQSQNALKHHLLMQLRSQVTTKVQCLPKVMQCRSKSRLLLHSWDGSLGAKERRRHTSPRRLSRVPKNKERPEI